MLQVRRKLIAIAVVIALFAAIWPKVRITIHIPVSPTQAWITLIIFAAVLFLAIDHAVNRTR